MNTTYFVWQDTDAKRPVEAKITDAPLRFEQKTGRKGTVCLVHPEQFTEVSGVNVRASGNVQKNTFGLGWSK